MNIHPKIAFITGASRGIGREIAKILADSRISIAIGYHTNIELANQLVDAIQSNGGHAIAVEVNLNERDSIKKAINITLDQLGPINILVNNAAISQEKSFNLLSDLEWDMMLNINLRGPFICCQEILPCMLKQSWGRIINVSSIGGQIGGRRQVHYAASKAGLISLSRSLANIYSEHGITINTIAPGLVSTDMSYKEINSEDGMKKILHIPIGRVATPIEIANTVKFIVSDEAAYITGQTINVNGGMYYG